MQWKRLDPYRWHRRFAVFPRRIGGYWIWLERYAWRSLPDEEKPPTAHLLVPGPPMTTYWTEFRLPNGYVSWRRSTIAMGVPFADHDWRLPKPKLRRAS